MSEMGMLRQLTGGNARIYLRQMENSAGIRLKGDSMELQFEWRGFDGDDCFGDFHINVVTQREARCFELGPSVIYGLRKMRKFFHERDQEEVDFGTCNLRRVDDGYTLTVRSKASGTNEEFVIKHPTVEIDDRFLTEYYDK
jgi:hypothetical protein